MFSFFYRCFWLYLLGAEKLAYLLMLFSDYQTSVYAMPATHHLQAPRLSVVAVQI